MPSRGKAGRKLRRLVLFVFSLPVVLPLAAWIVTPPSTLMLARYATLRPVHRDVRPLDQLGPYLPRAVILSEDSRFCSHHGVDWQALREVMDQAEHGEPSRGASTIPMQTAKNLFLWHGRSYVRKAVEIPLALWLDAVWSKRRMMEIYLNMAEWGDGIFGAEAAAQAYFRKSAARLSPQEAALLAAALPNPILRNPARPGPATFARARRLAGPASRPSALTACLSPR